MGPLKFELAGAKFRKQTHLGTKNIQDESYLNKLLTQNHVSSLIKLTIWAPKFIICKTLSDKVGLY